MKVLAVGNMYPPHHLGGYEVTWHSAVAHLRAAGHTVRVLTTDFEKAVPDSSFEEHPDTYRELRWYWHEHEFPPLSRRERVALERHNGRVFERHVEDMRPDAINWWAMGGMSLSLIERARRAGLPAVGVVGDDWMVYGPKVDAWTRLSRRLGVLGAVAGRLVGVPGRLDLSKATWLFNSDATRRRALEAGFRLEDTAVVHPGIDAELFTPATAHDWRWRLLYVGRIDARKGIDLAVEALSLLPDEATLTILGEGDDSVLTDLKALVARRRLERRVEFASAPRPEVPRAYAAADALLFPTRWEEPWGLVPLEAMAVGTPVVATGTGGSAEYLGHEHNALVVGAGAEPADLAAAVRRLAGEPGLRQRLREGGFATAPCYTEHAYNAAIEAALGRAAGRRMPQDSGD